MGQGRAKSVRKAPTRVVATCRLSCPDAAFSMAIHGASVFFGPAVVPRAGACISTGPSQINSSVPCTRCTRRFKWAVPLAESTLPWRLHNPTAAQTFKIDCIEAPPPRLFHPHWRSVSHFRPPGPRDFNFVQPTIVVPENPDASSLDLWEKTRFSR